MLALQALSLGHALDVRAAVAGTVHSVFAHAMNLELRGDLWTLLSAERADLPFGIRVAYRGFDALDLRRGDPVYVKAGCVGVGVRSSHLVVDCRAAPRWVPVRPPAPAPGLAHRLGIVEGVAQVHAWQGSARMARDLVSVVHDDASLRAVLRRVIGCGPGATPAGDDVLVGMLAALWSPHAGAAGVAAAGAIWRAACPLLSDTTDLSAHLLRQAANGWFSRTVLELLRALSADAATEQLQDATRPVIETGATSGADLCMGLVAAGRAFLLTHYEAAVA